MPSRTPGSAKKARARKATYTGWFVCEVASGSDRRTNSGKWRRRSILFSRCSQEFESPGGFAVNRDGNELARDRRNHSTFKAFQPFGFFERSMLRAALSALERANTKLRLKYTPLCRRYGWPGFFESQRSTCRK